jgi:hypothetical protein
VNRAVIATGSIPWSKPYDSYEPKEFESNTETEISRDPSDPAECSDVLRERQRVRATHFNEFDIDQGRPLVRKSFYVGLRRSRSVFFKLNYHFVPV